MVTDLPEPEVVLRKFFEEMYNWEIESRMRSKRIERGELEPNQSHRESRDALSAIFGRFCVSGGHTQRGIRYQHPPEYNPHTEKIIDLHQVASDRIELFTEQTDGWRQRRKFTACRVAGEWRIASKHRINAEGDEVEESL